MTAIDAAANAPPRSFLDRLFDRVPLALGAAGAAGIFAILVLMSYEIVARYIFNSPTNWSVEVSTYILVGAAYLGAGQVGHVAGMGAFGRLHPVLLGGRVEVPARAGEGRFAFADGVDMERMLAGDGAFQRHPEEHAVRRLEELHAADILAGCILQ